jgi:UDP-N-acetyl-D-glucosamine dehydrogenase
VADALNEDRRALNGARVLVLGVAYKKDSDDVRESPALDLMTELVARKAQVSYHDPYVAHVALGADTYASQPLTPALLQAADCVVVATDHSAIDWALVRAQARVVVDARNALRAVPELAGGARVVKL